MFEIEVEAGDLEPALVLRVLRAAVDPVDEHEIGRRLRTRIDAPARKHARHRDAARVYRPIEAELPLGHYAARAVLGERVELDLAVVEAQRQTGAGIVLHLRDQHVGQIELVDLGLRPCGHADQRRTVEVLARRRHRQQRRQSGIAVQRERQRRESRFAGLA